MTCIRALRWSPRGSGQEPSDESRGLAARVIFFHILGGDSSYTQTGQSCYDAVFTWGGKDVCLVPAVKM